MSAEICTRQRAAASSGCKLSEVQTAVGIHSKISWLHMLTVLYLLPTSTKLFGDVAEESRSGERTSKPVNSVRRFTIFRSTSALNLNTPSAKDSFHAEEGPAKIVRHHRACHDLATIMGVTQHYCHHKRGHTHTKELQCCLSHHWLILSR